MTEPFPSSFQCGGGPDQPAPAEDPATPILSRLRSACEEAYDELGKLGYAYAGPEQWQVMDMLLELIEHAKGES